MKRQVLNIVALAGTMALAACTPADRSDRLDLKVNLVPGTGTEHALEVEVVIRNVGKDPIVIQGSTACPLGLRILRDGERGEGDDLCAGGFPRVSLERGHQFRRTIPWSATETSETRGAYRVQAFVTTADGQQYVGETRAVTNRTG